MSGGAVSGNTSTAAAGRSFGREVLVNGSFKISGDAQPERIFLYKDDWYITISGDLSGPVIPIDLGIENSKPLSAWEGKQILQLDGAYSGTLAGLKSHFSLGNAKRTDSLPYTEAAVTGYVIADDGEVAAE
jgi:hypothetical protein